MKKAERAAVKAANERIIADEDLSITRLASYIENDISFICDEISFLEAALEPAMRAGTDKEKDASKMPSAKSPLASELLCSHYRLVALSTRIGEIRDRLNITETQDLLDKE